MNITTQPERVRALIRRRGPLTTEQLMGGLGVTRQRVARIMFGMNDAQRIDVTPLRGLGAKPLWSLTGPSSTA
jgi:hypothetical protein